MKLFTNPREFERLHRIRGNVSHMAARSRSVGRYDLVVEVAKSQIGPLWAATVPGAEGLEPRLVRCFALGPNASVRDVEALGDVGRWSNGFAAEQAVDTLDVVDAGRDLALVTSYVPGETLRSLLRLANFKREPIAARIALALTRDVCKGLSAAEARAKATAREPEFLWGGLLPDSILIGTDGSARVLDLGVASMWRRVSSEALHPEVVAYSAPERLERRELSANTDVFTLGILLWEMLSGGKRLFPGASERAVVEKLRKFSASVPPQLPGDALGDARALLGKMLEPDPSARLSDLGQLEQELEALGDAVAPAREVADFLTSFAAHPLESRERTLGRALQRGAEQGVRRPVSEPPPRPTNAPAAKTARPELPGRGAAKPLPLPAQAKLGGRLGALDGRVPPPPVPALVDIDARANDEEETGSVRAEDILAALAVEDLEPETDPPHAVATAVPVPEPEPVLAPELEPDPVLDAAESAVAPAPISSGRRAPLTAVVVPSVVAGPDATFTPVPSVLQTLRGPGVPPLGSDGLASEWVAASAVAAAEIPSASAKSPGSASTDQTAPVLAATPPTKIEHAVRGARQRSSGSLVAALAGTALLLLIALVSSSTDKTESAAEPPSKLLAAQRDKVDQRGSAEQPRRAHERAPAPETKTASLGAPKPVTVANANPSVTAEADDAKPAAGSPENEGPATLAVAAVAATPRVAAPRPARRSSAAARATTSATKKKKIRATRKYIPLGI